MEVGINQPWVKYGEDFGLGVSELQTGPGGDYQPDWIKTNGTKDKPQGLIRQLLEYQDCGITAVRWFILADGWNYGTPKLDNGRWKFNPPDLNTLLHVKHFDTLLKAFQDSNTGIRLVPCFIDFNFLGQAKVVIPSLSAPNSIGEVPVPPGTKSVDDFVKAYYEGPAGSDGFSGTTAARRYRDDTRPIDVTQFIKGGRTSVLESSSSLNTFLTNALQPLLDVSRRYPKVILAWDVINEPEVVLQFSNTSDASRTVTPDQMQTFLIEASKLVCKAGFSPTIGFQNARSLGLDDGSSDIPSGKHAALARLAKSLGQTFRASKPPFLGQFHYYPEYRDQKKLADLPNTRNAGPSVYALGEFASQIGAPWPETTAGDGIVQRLAAINGKKYDYAFLWSAQNVDSVSSWRAKEWAAVKKFAKP